VRSHFHLDPVVSTVGEWLTLDPPDFTLKVVADADRDSTTFDAGAGIVVLDTRPDPKLISEGLARDFVRLVQQSRNRIVVRANLPTGMAAAVTRFGDFVRQETLANELLLCAEPLPPPAFEYEFEGEATVRIAVARAG
jgi:isoleucyl-tRNA synthetase